MKASVDWLKEYVDLGDKTPREIADQLTMVGLEVEDLQDRFAFLTKVICAQVAEVKMLTDTVKLARVFAGPFGSFEVVSGAPNLRKDLLVPLALPGVLLPNGTLVKAQEIRGRISKGMLCSEFELGLGLTADRLLEIENGAAGQTLKDLTGREEWIMEIGITPNRPDALSVMGLARDLSAALDRPLKKPRPAVEEPGPPAEKLARVDIEAQDHAFRYTARVLTGVKIAPSPYWLADRLAAVGLRSINNIVDVTNYVMMELGLPLHAYDLNVLAERRIVVKMYKNGEKITTLDGQERELKAAGGLMICDGRKAIGLAGIMGGLNSEITGNTTDILLEGACFNATTIRRTSRSLGLSTDASYRFERGADPEVCPLAVDRAIDLMARLAGGQVAQGRLDCYPRPYRPITVPFSPNRCNALLGTRHRTEDMIRVLQAIGLDISSDGRQEYTAVLPSWRPDLHREVDVWEEVVRLLDFDRLPATLPAPPSLPQPPPPAWALREKIRKTMIALGFCETVTYSFINPSFADKLELPSKSIWRQRQMPILNPLSEEQAVLRPLLAPSLLAVLRHNLHQGARQAALFEAAAVYLSQGSNNVQPEERQSIAGLWAGTRGRGNWCDPERPVDFWDLKGVIEALTDDLGLPAGFTREADLPPYYDPAESAAIILSDGRRLGHLGRLKLNAALNFGLKDTQPYLFELDAEEILKNAASPAVFRPWLRYPAIERDLALVLDVTIPADEVLTAIKEAGRYPLTRVKIFDLYQGPQLPAGKKSLALRLTFQDSERTLTDEEVSGFCREITGRLGEKYAAVLRA